MLNSLLAAIENSAQIYIQHIAPVLLGYIYKQLFLSNSGVVYYGVYSAEALLCLAEQPLDLLGRGNVRVYGYAASAGLLYAFKQLVRFFGAAEIIYDYVPAAGGKAESACPAYSSGRAGYYYCFFIHGFAFRI